MGIKQKNPLGDQPGGFLLGLEQLCEGEEVVGCVEHGAEKARILPAADGKNVHGTPPVQVNFGP